MFSKNDSLGIEYKRQGLYACTLYFLQFIQAYDIDSSRYFGRQPKILNLYFKPFYVKLNNVLFLAV